MHTLDWNRINALVAQRYLSVQKHPEGELYICNYTAKAQYDAFWNDYTRMCRGLIIDPSGRIRARPFAKFFNLGEVPLDELPKEPFEVYEKMDGSLGILYRLEGIPQIATRGSFVSEQAQVATRILHEKYQHLLPQLNPDYTYLFEIIYPENRIVVDYGPVRDLFLLAIVDTESGKELPLADIGFPLVKKHNGIQHLTQMERDAAQQHIGENQEGFVIRFQSGMRVKVKSSEYVRLHRIITGLSVLDLWQYLSEGESLDELLEKVPDEVYTWVKQSVTDLQRQYQAIEEECKRVYKEFPTRKETALYFQQQRYPHILFAMLSGKDYAPFIWRMLRPDGNQTYFSRDDAKN